MFPAMHAPYPPYKSVYQNQGFSAQSQGFSNQNQGFSNQNQGFSTQNHLFLAQNQGFSTVSPSVQNTPVPFLRLSQQEVQAHLQLPASQTTLTALRFVPCLCGSTSNKEDRWSKSSYQPNIPYSGNIAGYQPIQLLPCYCPVVRDIEPQYVQQSPVSTVSEPVTSDYGSSTSSSKV